MFTLEVKGTFLECRKTKTTRPRANSQPASKREALDDVTEREVYTMRARSYTFSLCEKIGWMTEPHATTKVEPLLPEAELYPKMESTASDCGPNPKDFQGPSMSVISPFADEVDSKWLPIADNGKALRCRMMSNCSTTCAGIDYDNATTPHSLPRRNSGILRKASWADCVDGTTEDVSPCSKGARRKISFADFTDNITEEISEPKTNVQNLQDVSANESCPAAEDFPFPLTSSISPFADGADGKWLPIADNAEALRNRMMSSCSTTCTGFDGDSATPSYSHSRASSGVMRKTSWADCMDDIHEEKSPLSKGTRRKISLADCVDGINESILAPTWNSQNPQGVVSTESAPETEELQMPIKGVISPFADGVGRKGLPIADSGEALRNRMVSNCSASCAAIDGDNATTLYSHSRKNSGVLRKASRADCVEDLYEEASPFARGTLRKISFADHVDNIIEEVLVPENEPKIDQTLVDKDYTTVMLCELPCRVTQTLLVAELEAMGFGDDYDFLYVPTRNESGLGYGFVNFLTPPQARAFQDAFQNHQFSGSQSKKICTVKPARLQGLKANMDQFVVPKRSRGKAKQPPFRAVVRVKEGPGQS